MALLFLEPLGQAQTPIHVYMGLTGKWYDQICSGAKVWEYRTASDYWKKRIAGRTHVVFSKGALLARSNIFALSTMKFVISSLQPKTVALLVSIVACSLCFGLWSD